MIRLASCSIETLENGPHDEALTQYEGFGNAVDTRRGGVGWSGSWGGLADFTRSSSSIFGGSSIPFELYRFTPLLGRVDSTDSGMNIERMLSAPIDMDTNGAVYVSLLISRALDTSADDSTGEDLRIELRDNMDTGYISFGVDSEEAFFIAEPGGITTTANDELAMNGTYFIVAKILTADDQSGQYDQIYLKAFESGADSIPLEEANVDWTLTGTTNENSNAVLDRIAIVGDTQALWSIDEVRIGTTYNSVAGRSICSESGTYLKADINRDCYVNFLDLVILSQSWLSCTDPGDPILCD